MQRRRRLLAGAAALLVTAGLPFLVTFPEASAAPGPGYWMLDSQGRIYAFGAAGSYGPATVASGARAVKIESTGDGNGAWVVDSRGNVTAFGTAVDHSAAAPGLQSGESIVTMARTASSNGYWLISSRGRTFNYGDAADVGDATDFTPNKVPLNKPVIDAAKAVTGNGVYLVAEDGGVFTMGDARFYGSTGNLTLNSPVKSLVPDPDGVGYWLIAGDGGVFSFDAPFRGSMGSTPLNGPVVGMVSFGNGYLQVGSDGGIFNFSNLDFFGSLGGRSIPASIVSVAAFASGGDTGNSTTTTNPGSSTTTPPGGSTTTTQPPTTTTTPPLTPGVPQQITTSSLGAVGITRSSASADGCKVAFESDADLAGIDALLTKPSAETRRDPNNSDSDGNNQRDIFLWNCADNSLKRITNGFRYFDENALHNGQLAMYPSSDAQTANGSSVSPSLSADGRYLAFSSRADDPGIDGRAFSWSPYHHAYGIFVLDTVTGDVERVDGTRAGEYYYGQDHGARESAVQISGNGQFIVYQQASRVVGGAANYSNQIYMYDRIANRTTLVSSNGANEMPGDAMSPTVSADGRTVAFTYKPHTGATTFEIHLWTAAPDLATNAGYWTSDPDRTTLPSAQTGTVIKLTTGSADSLWPRLSGDGTRVAFTSYASLIGAGDTNAPNGDHKYADADRSYADIFVCSRGGAWAANCSGGLSRVTSAGTGAAGPSNPGHGSLMASISADGRYVSFQSDDATPLDTSASGSGIGVFVYDLTGASMRLAQFASGAVRQGPFLAPGTNLVVYSDDTGDFFRQTFT